MSWLQIPNVNGLPNSDVLRRSENGESITRHKTDPWIIDFPPETTLETAARYELPFEYIKNVVYPVRCKNRRASRASCWWIHGDPQKSMRSALLPLGRFICTPRVSKHRIFVWLDPPVLADCQLVVFTRSDDYFFGVLHSRVHEVWARSQGTQVRERESGFRYTPTTCFETFPFPQPTAEQRDAIAAAAKELDALRCNWLNPPDWTKTETLEFLGTVNGPWKRFVHDPDERGVGTVRYSRTVAKDEACAAKIKVRTLTKLYNEMPTWLKNAHRTLDEAVLAAYGWPADLGEDNLLARLLELNLSRSVELPRRQ